MSTKPFLHAIPILLFAVPACTGEDASPSELAVSAQALVDGTPAAVGVLRFLNDASTTFEVLDDGVPLPSNAARNLISRRYD